MKQKIKKWAGYGLGLALLMAVTGCDDELAEVNREFEQKKVLITAKSRHSEPVVLKSTTDKKTTVKEKKKKTVVRTTVKF